MNYAFEHTIAARATESARAAFIRRTYLHLAGAVLAFVALEFLIFQLVDQATMEAFFARAFASPWTMLLVFGGFMAVSYIARWWASSGASPAMQYAGLSLYVVAEALIFVPLLHIAIYYVRDPNLLPTAGILTLSIFGGLTVTAFVTRKDFSFLAPILSIASFIVLGIIICALFLPVGLGLWFSVLMVVIASGFILYDTSNVIHHYRTDQHVAAALSLFASLAILFYYILRILMQMRR